MMKRKPGLTQDEFTKYWKEIHAFVALNNIPGLVKYVQNHKVKLNDREPVYDGIAELWFQDLESFLYMGKWYRSDEGKILRDDEAKFIDTSKMVSYVCEEAVIKERESHFS
jgi:uncharacterized protein (TIGR02118 family)